jgi:rhamnulokinase
MPEPTAVAAVDFGASSVRVCRVDLGRRPPDLEVVHRHHHWPLPDGAGHLRWDWERLVAEMERGLELALERGPLASIGVDTWGVDYGLLDGRGNLVAPPFSYRDSRTDGYEAVADRIGRTALYETTGLQLQPFNTLFQVAVHDRDEMAQARHLLLLPELLVHHLTGEMLAEPTSAGTTGLVDIRSRRWSEDLAGAVGLDSEMLVPIEPAGTRAGRWKGTPVHLVGGHDTASAVVAMGARPGAVSAFVSSGTWLLVGREQPAPILSDAARETNFTNERGALGGIRFLKNLAGSWLIEGCRAAWGNASIEDLMAAAANVDAGPEVDVTDPRFLHPDDMLGEVTAMAGLPRAAPAPVVLRCIVDSMAAGTAHVFDQLAAIDGHSEGSSHSVSEVYVFGGSQSALYRRSLIDRTGLPVHPGPTEATALGNALVQGIALGIYADLAEARAGLDAVHDAANDGGTRV